MEESESAFPFRNLRKHTFLTLEVLMNVERTQALRFMNNINKDGRLFLQQEYTIIKNGFINEGLIDYYFSSDYDGCEELERLYFEALKRNRCNRKITLDIYINKYDRFFIFNELINWIYAQN